jgi:predicted DNA-binding transcriptional regulator YafY
MGAHWYIVARDVEAAVVKNFRVNRIVSAKMNPAKSATSDYTIPASFNLREHARSRQAWELGEGDSIIAEVEVRGTSGATVAAAGLGHAVAGDDSRKTFTVRRPDVFARWCLSFAGEIVPVAPASIVAEYDRQRAETRALYER